MAGTIQRLGRNLGSKLRLVRPTAPDPKVELERVVAEVHGQHGSLVEQAEVALAEQRDVELELDATITRLEKLTFNSAAAERLADEAARAGDTIKEAEHRAAAASFRSQADALEREVERLDHLALQRAISSDAAKAGARASAAALEQRLVERHEALAAADRADLEARLEEAKQLLSEPLGTDTPTVEEVEARIKKRSGDTGAAPA